MVLPEELEQLKNDIQDFASEWQQFGGSNRKSPMDETESVLKDILASFLALEENVAQLQVHGSEIAKQLEKLEKQYTNTEFQTSNQVPVDPNVIGEEINANVSPSTNTSELLSIGIVVPPPPLPPPLPLSKQKQILLLQRQ